MKIGCYVPSAIHKSLVDDPLETAENCERCALSEKERQGCSSDAARIMGGIAPYEAQIPHLARSSRGSKWRCFTIFFHVCASSSRYRSPQSTFYVMMRCTMGGYPPPPPMSWKKEIGRAPCRERGGTRM